MSVMFAHCVILPPKAVGISSASNRQQRHRVEKMSRFFGVFWLSSFAYATQWSCKSMTFRGHPASHSPSSPNQNNFCFRHQWLFLEKDTSDMKSIPVKCHDAFLVLAILWLANYSHTRHPVCEMWVAVSLPEQHKAELKRVPGSGVSKDFP